jgi:uncharacterized membrane protein YozB (DUF420 family)
MLTGPTIILTLKVLVTLVTVLFTAAIVAIVIGERRWHGRLNWAFFILTMTTVIGFEMLLRLGTDVSATFSPEAKEALRVHLYFAIPSAILLPMMLYTGATHRRRVHLVLATAFTLMWIGTLITGLGLPHE